MPLEQEQYEKGWGCCTLCKTRRPLSRLTDGTCQAADSDWCQLQQARNRKETEKLTPLPQPTLEHAGDLVADLEAAKKVAV
jgi:hypothetical protein